MQKRRPKKLILNRETLILLTPDDLGRAGGALGTLTYEGSCENSFCPCPTTRTQTTA
jgi:hypothetical protein